MINRLGRVYRNLERVIGIYSLLLKGIVRCGYGFAADDVTDCTYPLFSVNDATTGYAVIIPQVRDYQYKK